LEDFNELKPIQNIENITDECLILPDDVYDIEDAEKPPEWIIRSGRRNVSIWRHCVRQAHHCDNLYDLLQYAESFYETSSEKYPAIEDRELMSIAESAWGIRKEAKTVLVNMGRFSSQQWNLQSCCARNQMSICCYRFSSSITVLSDGS
jgi:hypothetical protein